jgi:hypothetical protein
VSRCHRAIGRGRRRRIYRANNGPNLRPHRRTVSYRLRRAAKANAGDFNPYPNRGASAAPAIKTRRIFLFPFFSDQLFFRASVEAENSTGCCFLMRGRAELGIAGVAIQSDCGPTIATDKHPFTVRQRLAISGRGATRSLARGRVGDHA